MATKKEAPKGMDYGRKCASVRSKSEDFRQQNFAVYFMRGSDNMIAA